MVAKGFASEVNDTCVSDSINDLLEWFYHVGTVVHHVKVKLLIILIFCHFLPLTYLAKIAIVFLRKCQNVNPPWLQMNYYVTKNWLNWLRYLAGRS